VRGLAHPSQEVGIPSEACTHVARACTLLQEHLQVVEHQQHPPRAQLLQQQTQAFFQGVGQVVLPLRGEHLQALLHQCGTAGGVAQGAPDHHLELRRDPAHHGHGERRLADATHTQHAHHPTALLDHPAGELRQFLPAIIEAWHIERLAPIHPRFTRYRRNAQHVSHMGLLARGVHPRGNGLSEQPLQPGLIQ